jgi:hypothetical protein
MAEDVATNKPDGNTAKLLQVVKETLNK